MTAQLTSKSDEACSVVGPPAALKLGPYLSKIPVNPLNGLNTVLVVPNGAAMPPAGMPDNSTGWIYKPQTMEIVPNSPGVDNEGMRYIDY
jgi:hypothetical protein